jgi:hypothetical protein
MTDKAPDKLHDDCTHLFVLAPDGSPTPHHLNLPLVVKDE